MAEDYLRLFFPRAHAFVTVLAASVPASRGRQHRSGRISKPIPGLI
jgi:hypothetical protein